MSNKTLVRSPRNIITGGGGKTTTRTRSITRTMDWAIITRALDDGEEGKEEDDCEKDGNGGKAIMN